MGRARYPGELAQTKAGCNPVPAYRSELGLSLLHCRSTAERTRRAWVLLQFPAIRGTVQLMVESLRPIVGRIPQYSRVVEPGVPPISGGRRDFRTQQGLVRRPGALEDVQPVLRTSSQVGRPAAYRRTQRRINRGVSCGRDS